MTDRLQADQVGVVELVRVLQRRTGGGGNQQQRRAQRLDRVAIVDAGEVHHQPVTVEPVRDNRQRADRLGIGQQHRAGGEAFFGCIGPGLDERRALVAVSGADPADRDELGRFTRPGWHTVASSHRTA